MSSDPEPIIAAKRYLVSCIRSKTAPLETKHPWRKSWEFVYFHSLRVDAILQKLLAVEAPGMPPKKVLALRLAAILHDIGRVDDRDQHGKLGAELTAGWLEANPAFARQVSSPERVIDLIAHHMEKTQPSPDLGHALLRDADALDEIGAFSIMMATNWLDRTSPFFFYDLADRLQQFEIPFCGKIAGRLQTSAARAYLAQKQRFVESMIAQLSLELEGIERDDPLLKDL
jgi:uncharacterized protein